MRQLVLSSALLFSSFSGAMEWQLVVQTPAIVVGPPHTVYQREPTVLVVHAPLVHQKYWPQYCHEYGACHQRVRFITVEPAYEQRHWHHDQPRHACHKHKRRHQHKRHHYH